MPTYPDINGQRPFGRMAEAQPDRVTMRLLVIEDDRDAADYLVKAFREVGHVADAATDGDDGLAMALSGQYDVLIVDRMLPKRDGLAVIGALRAKGMETPALILSALGQVAVIEDVADDIDLQPLAPGGRSAPAGNAPAARNAARLA